MKSIRNVQEISLDAIGRDHSNQMRAAMRDDVIAEYAEAMAGGKAFDPIIVYTDGLTYHLSDGFHRVEAAQKAGATSILAEVREGAKRDSWLNSLGVNDAHGLRRSAADKRNAVAQALADDELRNWSDNAIATACNVSPHTVKSVRDTLQMQGDTTRTYQDRWGNTTTMDTASLGRKPEPVDEVSINESLATVIRRLVVQHGADDVRRAADAVLTEMAEW